MKVKQIMSSIQGHHVRDEALPPNMTMGLASKSKEVDGGIDKLIRRQNVFKVTHDYVYNPRMDGTFNLAEYHSKRWIFEMLYGAFRHDLLEAIYALEYGDAELALKHLNALKEELEWENQLPENRGK